MIRSSDKILIKTFDQLKNDNLDQLNFGQVIIPRMGGSLELLVEQEMYLLSASYSSYDR